MSSALFASSASLRRRRARISSPIAASSLMPPRSTLLALVLLCSHATPTVMSETTPSSLQDPIPTLRGLTEREVGKFLAAAEGASNEGSAYCHSSGSFLGVGNVGCLHENMSTAVFLLAVIVAVSVGVERLVFVIRAGIECPQLRKIVNRIFEEVMIMGFLSMVIFTLNTSGAMASLNLNQNGLTSTEQLHLYEFFHYIVFLTMIYFIAIVLLLLFVGTVVPKIVWEIKNRDDDAISDSDSFRTGDFAEDRSDAGSDHSASTSHRRMRHSFIRPASYLDQMEHASASSALVDGNRSMNTPPEEYYTSLHGTRASGDERADLDLPSHQRSLAMRSRAQSGMDLVMGSRAYSLLLQRYQREGWGFRFNVRKQWNLWKSFEILAYNICQNRSGYIYKNPTEMERLFDVRTPSQPSARAYAVAMGDSLDPEDGNAGGVGRDDEDRMTYAKYHVLCMRNLLFHMTDLHPSAFLILVIITLLPSLFPEEAHWIFLIVGGLLLLVNVVIFFKVLRILRGIVDDRLRIITMREIQARLEKTLKDSDTHRFRLHGRRPDRSTDIATSAVSSSPGPASSDSSESLLSPGTQKLTRVLQARRHKGPIKFKSVAMAVRSVIRMQMSALCHRQLHHHDHRFWFDSPKLLLRLFQFATIGQAFYLVWLSLVEAQSALDASAPQGGGPVMLFVMVLLPLLSLFVITPLTMPSLVLVMSLTGIFVDLNSKNGAEDGRHAVTREEAKIRMRIMRRSFLKSHYVGSGEYQHPPPPSGSTAPNTTPSFGPGASPSSPVPLTINEEDQHDGVGSPTNVFLRIYDSPVPSPVGGYSRSRSANNSRHYYGNGNSIGRNANSVGRNNNFPGRRRGHNSSTGSSVGSTIDDSYGSSRRAFNLAAFQAGNSSHQQHPGAQSASSFTSTTSSGHRSPRPGAHTENFESGTNTGTNATTNWSQAKVEPPKAPVRKPRSSSTTSDSKSRAKSIEAGPAPPTAGPSRDEAVDPVAASFKSYCSKYGGYPDL